MPKQLCHPPELLQGLSLLWPSPGASRWVCGTQGCCPAASWWQVWMKTGGLNPHLITKSWHSLGENLGTWGGRKSVHGLLPPVTSLKSLPGGTLYKMEYNLYLDFNGLFKTVKMMERGISRPHFQVSVVEIQVNFQKEGAVYQHNNFWKQSGCNVQLWQLCTCIW